MLKRLLFALFLCSFYFTAPAQDDPGKYELAPCGTAPEIDPWVEQYRAFPQGFAESGADTLYAGVQVHLLARDNGSGRFSNDRLLDAFCRLNSDFGPSAIRFYFKNDWNLLDKTAWFQHDSITQGIQMMFANNVADALNAYFMSNPAGNCGYNLPYAGVAIGHNCAGPNDHTWAHEVGHALGLPHPFIGWEGKVYNFNNPTPDTLTYDYTHFHASPDTIVPAPLDTALVEYLDGSNCGVAADKVCDTKPDYLSYRWNCNAQGTSTVQQKDPAGATFFSDGSLYMSYANDACQNRFSNDQIQIMRAKLQGAKANWLAAAPQGADITSVPELIAPLNGAPAPATGALLQWKPVSGATHYVVQASRISSFAIRDFDQVVTDTSVLTTALLPNVTYYWRVRPFNAAFACTGYSTTGRLVATPVSTVQSATAAGWKIYPSILQAGQILRLEAPAEWSDGPLSLRVFDTAGRMVWTSEQVMTASGMQVALPVEQWNKGTYFLLAASPQGLVRQTLTVVGN